MKKFIITVDTEGDDLWHWKPGNLITTHNAEYLERFQNLCENYGFKPVYLVNYEMAQSDILVSLLSEKARNGLCEIGMHLHAWNTPPEYEVPVIYNGCPYITEYPQGVIKEKHVFLRKYIEERFGVSPISYRAGRWATNDQLFNVLNEIGIKVDCSITPGITHKKNAGMSVSGGNDYSEEGFQPRKLIGNLVEIPMSTIRVRSFYGHNIKNRLSHLLKGEELWLRPAVQTSSELIRLTKHLERKKTGYLEFMIHSSELMPGGSPYCMNEMQVEEMYKKMENYFNYISSCYVGVTLKDYYEELQDKL